MAVLFSPWGNSQFLTSSGAPANGWKIYAYVAGSSTPLATYTDSTGTVAQSNPIILNSLGFPTTGQIWLTSGLMYKLVLTDSSDVVQKTEDNISGVLSSSSSSLSQWVASGLTPTYVSATSFTLSGDQTSAFHVGRRLQTTNTSGTIYSRIVASAYTTLTTVTVVNDSGVLDSGLSSVNYGLLTATSTSTPGAASPVLPRIDVASVAGTVDLTGNATIDDIRITGTNAITAFTVATGRVLRVTAGGAFTLTNNASIVTQTGANITCASGDTFMIRATAANVVEVMNYVSVVPAGAQIQSISAVATNNTIIYSVNPTTLDFRNTNLIIGTPNRRTLSTASNITIPQGATLGAANGVPYTIYAGAIDNAGTIEPIVGGINCNFDESQLINTTAISNAANSSNVFYSTTARTNVPLRNLGLVYHNQSTAGTYAAQPTQVQGNGGITQTGQFKYLQFPSIATTSGTTADQLNIPSWAKRITVRSRGLSTTGTSTKQLQIGAGAFVTSGYLSQGSGGTNGNVIAGFSITSGFGLGNNSIALNTNYFSAVLQYEGAGVWTYTATNSGAGGQTELWVCGGELTLTGGTLDRIRLTTVNGTDAFDAGSFSVLVEG